MYTCMCVYMFVCLNIDFYCINTICDGLNNDPKDVHILIIESYEYINLHGKKICAGVIKLWILRLRDYPGLPG